MKKVTLVVLVFLLLSPPAWGAGMLACTPYDKGVGYFVITCTATADASGSFPATSLSGVWPQDDSNQGGFYIFQAEFLPGSTAPTNGYQVSIKDNWGVDLLLGKGAALSNAASSIQPGIDTFSDSAPTVYITGNSVAGAVANFKLTLVR